MIGRPPPPPNLFGQRSSPALPSQDDPLLGAIVGEGVFASDRFTAIASNLGLVTFGVGIWAVVAPVPYAPLMIVLIMMPIACVAAARWSDGWLSLNDRVGSTRPELARAWMFPCVVLPLRAMMDFQWLGDCTLLVAVLVLGALMAVALLSSDRRGLSGPFVVFFVLVAAGCWAYGTLAITNGLLWPRLEKRQPMTVVSKDIPGGRHPAPEMRLQAEGDPKIKSMFVNRALYSRVNSGGRVCVLTYVGGLGWRWSTPRQCPSDVVQFSSPP